MRLWLSVVGLLLIISGLSKMVWIEYQRPVERIEVRGEYQIFSRVELSSALLHAIGAQSYWGVDIDELASQIRAEEWINSASISRLPEKTLEVLINQQRPIAKWNDQYLISQSGELFDRLEKILPESLPQLRGPDYLLNELQQEYLFFNDVFRDKDVAVVMLKATDDGQRYLRLSNDIQVMLGTHNVNDNILRFNVLWDTLSDEQKINVERIDMRYDNAAAIAWR